MNDNRTITIDLADSVDARTFNRDESVHPLEFDQILNLIDLDIIRAREAKDEPNDDQFLKDRFHNAITVLGTRGSGKTSFLLSVLNHYNKRHDLAVLKLIDPTLIEEKGHIFLIVVSIIKEMVEKKLNKVGYQNRVGGETHRKAWDDLLEDLAGGLPSIDGIGMGTDQMSWQDPEYIMQRGIRLVTASRHLENNFDKLVRFALNVLDKEAFVLAFDDIDIDFKKGWPVLETIRKYLVTPKVITLLSGDMRLYSLSVRKRQWHNFGDELVANPNEMDKGASPYLQELVRETESQYLQKVMKPERRIHLGTLRDKSAQGIYISIKSENQPREIADHYSAIFNRAGIFNNYQIEIYQSFLLNSPLRLQLRFLGVFVRSSGLTAGLALLDPFVSDLYEQRVDASQVASSPQFVNIGILNFLLNKRLLSENYQLQPLTDNAGLNGTMTAFTLLFSIHSQKNAAAVFDYLVRVGYTRNILSSIGYDEVLQNPGLNQHTPTIEGLCRHAGLLQDKVLKDSIGMANAYVNAFLETGRSTEKSWGGMVILPGRAKRGKRNSRTNRDRIDSVAAETNELKSALIYFPLTTAQSAVSQNETLTYSFNVLLAVIAELIRKTGSDDTFKGMLELAQLRSYPMPDFKQKSNASTGTDFDGDDIDDLRLPHDSELRSFENKLKNWVLEYPGLPVPPHILGKISTRVFFAFTEIHRKQQRRKLGEIMHAMCVTFLNAVLIEDAKEHLHRPGINLNNPVYSDRLFITNLNSLRESAKSLKLSIWFITCPLFLAYIDPHAAELQLAIDHFCESHHHRPEIWQFSVYDELQQVRVKQRVSMPRDYESVINVLQNMEVNWEELIEKSNDEHELNYYLSQINTRISPQITFDRLKRVIEYRIAEEDE